MPSSGSEIRLSFAIQHHPLRADSLPPLATAVGHHDVVLDPDPESAPSPLRTYLEALRQTPFWASHRLILQDDVTVCRDFRARAERAVAEYPASLLCLFVPGGANAFARDVRGAALRGDISTRIGVRSWVPVVATCWPRELALDFLDFMSDPALVGERSDDAMVGRYARARRLEVRATVPSLVEHRDDVPSLIGRKHRSGGDRSRVAAIWSG